MPSTSRRSLLRAGAATLAGLAGCLGSTGDDPTTTRDTTTTRTTPDTTTTETTRTTTEDGSFSLPESSVRRVGDARVAVANPVARKAVAYASVMGSGGVLAPANRQFVVAAVQSATDAAADSGAEPSYADFELVAGGDSYPAVEIEEWTTGAFTTSLAGRGRVRYDASYPTREVGWLAFEPPSPLRADRAAVRCRYGGETAEWRLPDDAVSALGRRAPSFELRSFDATQDGAGQVTLSLVAENVADVDGEFLAAVYWPTARIADDDESIVVRQLIAAGDRVEWSQSVDTEYARPYDGDTVTASVDGVVTGSTNVTLEGMTSN